MTEQHTTGPWRIGDAGFTVFGPPNGTSAPEVVAPCKTRANARLIAAAPELLAALNRIADSEPRPNRNRDFDPDVVEALQRIARAAVAKAKGEKP